YSIHFLLFGISIPHNPTISGRVFTVNVFGISAVLAGAFAGFLFSVAISQGELMSKIRLRHIFFIFTGILLTIDSKLSYFLGSCPALTQFQYRVRNYLSHCLKTWISFLTFFVYISYIRILIVRINNRLIKQ